MLDITPNMVREILKSLDTTKAVGPDLVHNKILRLAADVLSAPLSLLFSNNNNNNNILHL